MKPWRGELHFQDGAPDRYARMRAVCQQQTVDVPLAWAEIWQMVRWIIGLFALVAVVAYVVELRSEPLESTTGDLVMSVVLTWAVWLFMKGYVAAFFLGAITAFSINIAQNSAQIRRNFEQIRRNSETIRRNSEAATRRAYGEASGSDKA